VDTGECAAHGSFEGRAVAVWELAGGVLSGRARCLITVWCLPVDSPASPPADCVGPQVSNEAKELVSQLLVVDPSKRLTCEQVLAHPWMTRTPEAGVEQQLTQTAARIQDAITRRCAQQHATRAMPCSCCTRTLYLLCHLAFLP
jgi:serine/threonine protein kinase